MRDTEPFFNKINREISDTDFFNKTEEAQKVIIDRIMHENNSGAPLPFSDFEKLSDEEKAKEIVYEAMSSDSNEERDGFLSGALALDPKCELAYEALADIAEHPFIERLCLEKVIEIGKVKHKDVEVGMYYSFFETRVFIRSMYRYGDTLSVCGEYEKATILFEDVVRLNKNDNMGARYPLLYLYIYLEKFDKAKDLLKKYKNDPSAFLLYGKALLAYITKDIEKYRDKYKKDAILSNKYVPKFLKREADDEPLPSSYQMGSKEEATIYADMTDFMWDKYAEAKEWICKK